MPQDDDLLVCQSCGAKFVKKAQTSQPEHSASDARQNEEVQNLKSRIADMEQKQAAMEVELAKAKKASQTNGALGAGKSGFTATVFELFAEKLLLMWVSMVTLGFAYPWLKCHYEGFIASKTYVKGRRLSFDGKGKDLAKKYYLWMLLCVVTFGIYSIFLADKLHKWVVEHTHYDGNEGGESSYDGKTGVIFGFKLASFFAGAFTLGLAKPFVECKREDYLCEHTIIDDSHLYFDGTGSGLLKKQVLWVALTIATCGVYAIWLNLQKEQWICANKSNDSIDMDVSEAVALTPEERARIAEEKRLQQEQERARRALERQRQKERLKEMKKTPQGKLSTALFAVAAVLFVVALALMITMLVEGPYGWFEPTSKALIAFEVIFSAATAAMMAGCIVCSKKIQRKGLTIAAIVLIVCSVGTMSAGFYGSSQAVKYSNVDPFFYELLDDGTYRASFNFYNRENDVDYQMRDAKEYSIVRLEDDLVIPSSYKGVPVTSVGRIYGDNITSITIPDSIKTIKDGAFEGMSGITEITIPASVENVGNGAFRNCTNLTTVYWNSSAEIKNNNGIFSGCTKLTNIIVGENVTKIPQTVYNEEWFNNQPDGLVIANNYVYGYKGTMPFNYSLTLPNGTLGIMDKAFMDSGSAITSVTIPDSVTYIGENAFSGCTGIETISASATNASKVVKQSGSQYLKTIIITSGSTIEPYAFSGCRYITQVSISNSVTSIGDSAFYECYGLTSVTIPNSVTSIGDSAFDSCTGLTSITIPDNVTSIGEKAFYYCTGLTSVTIGNGVTSIGERAFYYCANLEEVHVESLESWCAIEFDGLDNNPLRIKAKLYVDGEVPSGNYVIPDGITTIPAYTFRNCTGLTSVTVPNSVTSIGEGAFSGCSSLESITIPFVGAKAGVTSSDTYQYPFGYIFGISSYDGGVATTQHYCYYGNGTSWTTSSTYYIPSSLKSVTVTGGNKLLGAFSNCTGLTSVTIPDSVTSIGDSAFDSCTGLTSITIPDNVTSIGEKAFYYCTGLTSITIPEGVTNIGNAAFSGCTGLTSITIPEGVTSIANNVFSNCTGLTSVTISDSLTSIGNSAFSGCTGLTSITIPDGVTSIGGYAFKNCSGLRSIIIPSSVTSIGYDAFDGCTNLQTVYYGGTSTQWNNISIEIGNYYLTSATLICDYDGTARTYTFVTNCDETIPSQTAAYLDSLPTLSSRTGYTFVGWYDNSSFEGNPVTAPYSSKDNTTLYAKWTATATGSSFDSAISASRGSSYTVNITTGGQIVYFVFRPTTSRTYTIQSTGSGDTYATLYNTSKSSLTYNDDGGNGNNFLISYSMTAGNTYYIAVKFYNSSTTGSFTVQFS